MIPTVDKKRIVQHGKNSNFFQVSLQKEIAIERRFIRLLSCETSEYPSNDNCGECRRILK